jgi:hypothetical protein
MPLKEERWHVQETSESNDMRLNGMAQEDLTSALSGFTCGNWSLDEWNPMYMQLRYAGRPIAKASFWKSSVLYHEDET